MPYVLLLLAAVGHTILWVTLVNRLHGLAIKRTWMNLLTAACGAAFLLIPLVVFVILTRPGETQALGMAGVSVWSYASGCAVVCLVGTVHWLWTLRHPERHGAMTSNHTTRLKLQDRVAEPLAGPGIPSWLARLPGNQVFELHLHEKELAIPRLSTNQASLRIAHVSDLHMSGRIRRAYFREAMDRVNECRPDLVAVTGDLVEFDHCLDWIPDTLGRLQAPGGVYYVLGNHDLRVDEERLKKALADAGLIHVGGRCLEVTVNDTPLVLAGNELPWYPNDTPLLQRGEREESENAPLHILLSHSPDQFRWAQERGFDLMLAGHSHGGQVRLPLFGPVLTPSVHGVRYASGVFRSGGTVLHVSRGTASFTPLRFYCPPEIALLVLRPGQ